jgi:hypothetical protein
MTDVVSQITSSVLMIRPTNFRKNEQTEDNYFQKELELKNVDVNQKAQQEFDQLVGKLHLAGIQVIQFSDLPDTDTPDSVFPNNWVSFHADGEVILYPMRAENRRKERRMDIMVQLKKEGFTINNITDYSPFEEEDLFLEGTGSLILDRIHKKIYCGISERCNEQLVNRYAKEFKWTPVAFRAYQTVENERKLIYHTNVMMCIGMNFALICLDCIDNKEEREKVVQSLEADGKEIISITEDQVGQFAGNMLQLQGKNGPVIVMSLSAYNALNPSQKDALSKHGDLIPSDLHVIETNGGGSARCMIAEIFLPNLN